jgi:hypothetical protein
MLRAPLHGSLLERPCGNATENLAAISDGRTLAVAEVSHSSYGRGGMHVRLWVVLSSLGAASCGDSVVIARELVVQAISVERADAGADAGDHVLGVPHGSSEGHPPSSAHPPTSSGPKPSGHPVVEPPRHSSASTSIPVIESVDGGSQTDKTSVHY